MRKSQNVTAPSARLTLLSKDGVLALLGNHVGWPTVAEYIRTQGFPAPLVLGPEHSRNSTQVWIEDEIVTWIRNRPRRVVGTGQYAYRGRTDSLGRPNPVLPPQGRKRVRERAGAVSEPAGTGAAQAQESSTSTLL